MISSGPLEERRFEVIKELVYSNYRFNRKLGMSPADLRKVMELSSGDAYEFDYRFRNFEIHGPPKPPVGSGLPPESLAAASRDADRFLYRR